MAEFGIMDLTVPTKVWLVWDTDQGGVFLSSIHSTKDGAEKAQGFRPHSSWVEEKEVDG